MRGVIYLVTNMANGKYYIGQTRDYAYRKYSHLRARAGKPLAHAINKYGKESFQFEIIGEAEVGPSLDALELLWTVVANSTDRKVGYNLRHGGPVGTFTDEVRARMSAKARQRTCRNLPVGYWTGRPNPHASRTWLGAKRGPMSDQHKEKLRQAKLGKPTGRTISAETRAKMIANRGPVSDEQKEALRKLHAGNKYNVGRKRPDVSERNRRTKCPS